MFYPSQEYAPIGSLKARYRPLGLVAQGQFGKVYCAVHRASGRLVALKLLDRQRSTTSQFLRELSSLLSLSHPGLTQLRAIEQTDLGRCLVLDYSSGGTLRQLLESPHLPRQELILKCLVQVLQGLAHAHDQGIVHCDVKPENILLQLEPQGWRACLTDFGIAQTSLGGNGLEGDPAFERGGSPAYMAPERFAGEAYRASDLYSMGIILYEVLLGDRPFHGSPTVLREAHRQEAVKFPPSLDISWQKLLFRALSKSPDLRYTSAEAMALDLSKALSTSTPPDLPSKESGYSTLFNCSTPEVVLPWPKASLAATRSFQWEIDHVVCLAGSSPQLWLSQGMKLRGGALDGLDHGEVKPIDIPSWELPEAIQDMALSSRYGMALTESALYRWSLQPGPSHSGENRQDDADSSLRSHCLDAKDAQAGSPPLQCLIEGQTNLRRVVLSPQGHWAGLVKRAGQELDAQTEDSLLLMNLSEAGSLNARVASIRSLKLRPAETLVGVQLLDRRHGAALIASPNDSRQRLGLFSRRGQWLSHFNLPVALDHWVRGIPAYELWAVEVGHPRVLLKVGLKPFRLERIPLAIAPEHIYPLPWGCLLANQAGELLLLNREGQSLGQLQVPVDRDCQKLWFTPLAPHCLMIGLQRSQDFQLFRLDLRELELMLVF